MNPAIVQGLGWTLIHFLWQGTALAVLLFFAVSMTLNPRVRYGLGVCALLLMALMPIGTFLFLNHVPDAALASTAPERIGTNVSAILPSNAAPLTSFDWLSCFVWTWSAGVLLFGMRAFGGWVLLQRLQRGGRKPISDTLLAKCHELQRRLRLSRAVRFVQSSLVDAPAVAGWLRPAVLLPASSLIGLSPEQLEAVIAHELAHIKRFDCFVNVFQIAVESVLFYHPAIWWVNRMIRNERENCCDDVAVSITGNIEEYARALTILETSRSAPDWVLAANGGALKKRVGRLLGLESINRRIPAAGLAAIAVLCASCVLVAATGFQDDAPPPPPKPPIAPAPAVVPFTPVPPAAPTARVTPMARVTSNIELVAGDPSEPPAAPEAPQAPEPPPASADEKDTGGSYIESLESVGLKNLSVDQLISLKVQGVTADYVRGMHAAGLSPSPHELIAMKVQGITPEYVKAMQSAGLGDLKIHDFISAKVQGVTPQFIEKVKKHGFKDLTLHQLIELKIAGIF